MEKNTEKRIYNVIFVLIILIACNLRAPITGVGSLVNMIGDSLGLSSAAAGFITTIPLLAFAAVSPFAVIAARKLGAGNVMVISLLILNFGVIARSFLGNVGLFAGTALVGLAIGVANVLLPAIIKTYFPDKIPFMTSMYTAVMQIVSAVSTAISVPIAIKSDWKWALAIWIIMASIALVIWLPNRGIRVSKESTDRRSNNVYKAPITRWVTIYMGVQSMIFYSFIAWLSPIMQHKGYEPVEAGYILSLYVIMGIIGSCMLPMEKMPPDFQVSLNP